MIGLCRGWVIAPPAVLPDIAVVLAGHDPFVDGKPAHAGKLGADLSTQLGRSAAHIVTLNLLATLKAELAARPVARIVKVVGRQLEPVDAAPLPAFRTTPTITMSPGGRRRAPLSPTLLTARPTQAQT